jgi:hypothetical protein
VRLWAVALVLLFVLLPARAMADHVDPDEIHEVLPRDAIIAVRTPKFAERDYLHPSLPVVGVEIDGDARAYPIMILNHHEIVNDVVGGVPVAVTFCPLCNTALVYDRRVGDMVLTFGVSGLLYKSNLVMYDEKTESLWVQITSEAIQGPLHGTKLTLISSTVVEWGTWREKYPQSLLLDFPLPQCDSSGLSEEPEIIGSCIDYTYNPYFEYLLTEDVFYGANYTDRILHPKAVVLGVKVGNAAMAYPYENLTREVVINDEINGLEVVVTYYKGSGKVFERQGLTFERGEDRYMLDNLGRQWDMVTGEGEDGILKEIPSVMSFWFAWADFNKGTGVYGYREPLVPEEPFPVQAIYIAIPAAILPVLAIFLYRRRKS